MPEHRPAPGGHPLRQGRPRPPSPPWPRPSCPPSRTCWSARRRSWPPTWRSAVSSSPGAGACCGGMDALLAQETGMATHLAEDPIRAVALGLEATLPHLAKRQEGGAEPGPPPTGGGVRPSGLPGGAGARGPPVGRTLRAVGALYEASGRSAPLPAYPAGGPPFLPRNGGEKRAGASPRPRFYSRSFPLADFCSSCLCNGRGAISSGMLRPIWDAFSRKNILESIFAKESFQIRVRMWAP